MGGFQLCKKDLPPLNCTGNREGEPLPIAVQVEVEVLEPASLMTPQGMASQWSSLFGSGSAPTLSYHEPFVCNGKKTAQISHDVHKQGLAVWKASLIGQFNGPASPKNQIQAVVSRLWGRRGRVEVLDLENGGFIFKFDDKQTLSWVLEEGPWFIAQKPLF